MINSKISEMNPSPTEILKAVETLLRQGVLAQDGYTGKVY